jgi:hypothetical protein
MQPYEVEVTTLPTGCEAYHVGQLITIYLPAEPELETEFFPPALACNGVGVTYHG